MSWLYLRYHEDTKKWYVGKTHMYRYHLRNSGSMGKFAVGMDGKELAVRVPQETTHTNESEAIQFLCAFLGRDNVSNSRQIAYPVTGWKWEL